MTKEYKTAIIYFLLFSLLLLLSGILLFEDKIGFSVVAVLTYYLGDTESFITAKSLGGTLKVALPHIFAFGLFSMVLLHFLIFTKQRRSRQIKLLIYLIFVSSFLEIFSAFFIILGADVFAYIKLFTFFLFEGLLFYLLWLLFFSIMYE